jgi:anaerobic ribonucleoside-triphosphate reductase activating protein
MNYHDITKDDMLNGDGLRVVLWVSGCTHRCQGCQNPITWDVTSGLPFDEEAEKELFEALAKPHCAGITFSGGDPFHPFNRPEVFRLAKKCKELFPEKTVWSYTGFEWKDVKDEEGMKYIDVLAEGRFVEELLDNNLHWVGSSNQKVINVPESLKTGEIVLHESK